MRIAVCDDEKIFRSQISEFIKEYDKNIQILEFRTGKELLDTKYHFDIIFLDIEMPGTDGLTTAKKLRDNNIDSIIIFLTSHDELVFESFKVNAFRFIRKSKYKLDLKEAMNSALKILLDKEKIIINQKGNSIEIYVKDIVYLEAFGDGTYIYDRYGNVHKSSEQLKVWDEKLNEKGFFKIHKSYIVSFLYIESRENDMVILKGIDIKLPISRRNITNFKELYLKYIKNNAHVI